MRMAVRIPVTLLLLVLWNWIEGFTQLVSPLVSGPAAVRQFDNSDVSYLVSNLGMRFTHITNTVVDIVFIAVLILLWVAPIRRLLKDTGGGPTMAAIILGTLLSSYAFYPSPALAYYQKSDYTEIQMVLPNQSAFLIPEVGANKDSQGQFGSVDYLQANKVAMKRVQIPHTTLPNSGVWANYVVPSARLILVDRTPYYREWSDRSDKGTSNKAEGFSCESKDSIDITTAVAISAFVTEEDAAKFLYWFGTKPPQGNLQDPEVIFSSVLYGRSLSEVMDTVVRGKVHAALCAEMGKRDLDHVFAEKSQIMEAVEKAVEADYGPKGITIDYIGFAAPLDYDKEIQAAINHVYTAEKDAAAANLLVSALPVLQQEADIRIKDGLAAGLQSKGLPALPSFMVVTPDLLDKLTGWFKTSVSEPMPTSAPVKK